VKPTIPVHRDQRRRLAEVDGLAVPDRLLGVVGASLLASALAQPLDDLLLVGRQLEDRIQLLPFAGEQLVEVVHLGQRPRVAVEEEAVPGILFVQPIGHELVRQGVGDVVSRIHDGLHLRAERGAVLDVRPEDVARGDVGDPVGRRDPGRLRALTRPRRTDDQHPGQRSSPS
jgi:hypothetical protein